MRYLIPWLERLVASHVAFVEAVQASSSRCSEENTRILEAMGEHTRAIKELTDMVRRSVEAEHRER